MKKINENDIKVALSKMQTTPNSLIGDSINYRVGYLRALQDLKIIDGLSASRMLIEIVNMKGWK